MAWEGLSTVVDWSKSAMISGVQACRLGPIDASVQPASSRSSASPDPVGVLAVLQDGAERRGGGLEVELGGAEPLQGARPVQGLGDAGRLEQVARPRSRVDGVPTCRARARRHVGQPAAQDRRSRASSPGCSTQWYRQRRLRASCTSRVRLEVRTTSGGVGRRDRAELGDRHRSVDSTSSRNASNSSSARSTSSTSSTRAGCAAPSSIGRSSRNRSSNSDRSTVADVDGDVRGAGASSGAQVQHLPGKSQS